MSSFQEFSIARLSKKKKRRYFTLGNDAREPELCVVIVSTVVIPRPTLAGAASILIQKEIQERITISRLGMYIWIR